MEAATSRSLAGDKAQRIVEAMRLSVARRGSAGSTFDHVSREARVSRGLLHYYFGTKEQLLVEVVRRDCEVRVEMLERQLEGARSAEDFIELLVFNLEDLVRNDPDFITLVFEVFTLSRRNGEIAAAYADLLRRTRTHVSAVLAAKQEQGVLNLGAEPDAVADVLFSLADGIALRMLAEPERDYSATVQAGVACVRELLLGGR
jgi:AcrR family transcriptional regulator